VPQAYVPALCTRCRGTGRLSRITESKDLRLVEFHACPQCDGLGRSASPPCEACGGRRLTVVERSLRVRVPAGVRDGDLLQVDGLDRRIRLAVTPRPRDSSALLLASALALACAVGLLLYLLVR
jgi:DnaJ-class molecular chaperone